MEADGRRRPKRPRALDAPDAAEPRLPRGSGRASSGAGEGAPPPAAEQTAPASSSSASTSIFAPPVAGPGLRVSFASAPAPAPPRAAPLPYANSGKAVRIAPHLQQAARHAGAAAPGRAARLAPHLHLQQLTLQQTAQQQVAQQTAAAAAAAAALQQQQHLRQQAEMRGAWDAPGGATLQVLLFLGNDGGDVSADASAADADGSASDAEPPALAQARESPPQGDFGGAFTLADGSAAPCVAAAGFAYDPVLSRVVLLHALRPSGTVAAPPTPPTASFVAAAVRRCRAPLPPGTRVAVPLALVAPGLHAPQPFMSLAPAGLPSAVESLVMAASGRLVAFDARGAVLGTVPCGRLGEAALAAADAQRASSALASARAALAAARAEALARSERAPAAVTAVAAAPQQPQPPSQQQRAAPFDQGEEDVTV